MMICFWKLEDYMVSKLHLFLDDTDEKNLLTCNSPLACYGVTHLKVTVKGKSYLVARNVPFLAEPLRYLHPCHCRSFIWFGVSSSLHQSPMWIKINDKTISVTLSRIAGPENLRLLAASNWVFTSRGY